MRQKVKLKKLNRRFLSDIFILLLGKMQASGPAHLKINLFSTYSDF